MAVNNKLSFVWNDFQITEVPAIFTNCGISCGNFNKNKSFLGFEREEVNTA